MKKINQFLSIRIAVAFSILVFIAACTEDDGFVVDTSDIVPGELLGDASTLSIANTESVTFTDRSTKVQSRVWTFPGGMPATSSDSVVTVSYEYGGSFTAKLQVTHIDNTTQTQEFVVEVSGPTGPGQTPFLEAPAALPGFIEFENYDVGGEGVAYQDTEEENRAVTAGSATYREDDGIDVEVNADGSLVNIGYSGPDEWMEYTVNVAEAGQHYFRFVVASGNATGGSSVKIQLQNGDEFTDLGETGNLDNTGGWATYRDLVVGDIDLPAGEQVLRFYLTGGGVNLDKVEVVAGDFEAPPVIDASASSLLINAGETVTFTDESTLVETRNWTFTGGDPATSSDAEVIVTYVTPGTYEARIDITHTDGSTGFQTFEIVVRDPNADITPLAFYTERPDLDNSNPIREGLPSNGANFIITEVADAAEGTKAFYAQYDEVNSSNPQTYGALLSMFPTSTLNLSDYNFYNISLKAPAETIAALRIRFRTNAGNFWVTLTDQYDFVRDGEWHTLKIPFADMLKDGNGSPLGTERSEVTEVMFRSDDADFILTGNFDWYFDDIYFSAE